MIKGEWRRMLNKRKGVLGNRIRGWRRREKREGREKTRQKEEETKD